MSLIGHLRILHCITGHHCSETQVQNFQLTFLNSKISVKGIFLRSNIQQCIETNRCKKESIPSLSFSTPNATSVMPTNPENAVFWKLKASGNTLLHQDITMATKKSGSQNCKIIIKAFGQSHTLPAMQICITPHLNIRWFWCCSLQITYAWP